MMDENYREAVAIANKIWAFFVGYSWDNMDGEEFVQDATTLRRFIENDIFDFMMRNSRSSSLIPKRGEKNDSD